MAEKIAGRQAELTEQALSLVYRAPEIFNHVRNPFRFGSLEGEKEPSDVNVIPLQRLHDKLDYFQQIENIRPSFKAIFGSDRAHPLDEILRIRHEISKSYTLLKIDSIPYDDMEKYRNIIYGMDDKMQ